MTFIPALKAALDAHADATRAPAMQAYMKSSMPFLGIAAALRQRLTKEAAQAHAMRDAAELAATMERLWRDARAREERYAAIGLPMVDRAHRNLITPALLPLLERIVVEGAWWDYVDDLSGNVLAELLRRHPSATKPVLRRWARGRDLWLRRAAMLCQRKLRGAAFDAPLFYETLLPSMGAGALFANEFFIRKGIGWALRERAYEAPDEVRAFCAQYKQQLSPLTRREALRVIDAPGRAHHDAPSAGAVDPAAR